MFARTLLVCLLLLAVPFQGYAAAAMACAHGVGSVAQAATPPCHAMAQKKADTRDDGVQAGHQKCGSCNACSVGAAIAPALPDTAAGGVPRGPRPASTPALAAAGDPDLPERPPRPRFA